MKFQWFQCDTLQYFYNRCFHLDPGFVAPPGYTSIETMRKGIALEGVFNKLNVDGFFLEYDTPRAGDFTPLRFVPKGRKVVLGLVSTKLPDLETADLLKKRIDEAARFMPIEQLCLWPQCGFASSARSALSMELVERKLARIVEVADQVWG